MGLLKAIDDTPRSSAEIAQRMGMVRNSVSHLLRRAHKERLCYIAEFKRNSGGRGMETPLWVVGAEENEKNDRAAEIAERAAKRAAHAAVPFKPDPLVAAFFGAAA
jgi:DNA-binding transcriptional regulator LsrR (DeoR family)